MSCTEKIPLVRGSTLPRVTVDLADAAGTAASLAGAGSATLRFRAVGGTTLSTITCDIELPSSVAFEFGAGESDVPAGDYEGELELIFGSRSYVVYRPLRFKVRENF